MKKINLNRIELLNYLPKGTVAEIGVAKGNFSKLILEKTDPEKLYLIDVWDDLSMTYPDKTMVSKKRQQKRFDSVSKYFRNYSKVSIIREKSIESSALFKDEYFDWIYIDADHSYDGCYNDLKAFHTKVKSNGYICGHDWLADGYNRKGFGVNDAVKDFVYENNYCLSIITNEDKYASFVISKNQNAEDKILVQLFR